MSGLLVNVYRNTSYGDCSNKGITSKYNEFLLIDEDENIGPFEVSDNCPTLKLVKRKLGTYTNDKKGEYYLHAVPVNGDGKKVTGGMFGGNFIYTSDSRFPSVGPIPVHDRFEGRY